jgi:hypothetical protein
LTATLLGINYVLINLSFFRRNNYTKRKIEAHPQLPKEIVKEILRFTFYSHAFRDQPIALRCTEVCKQWKDVIEQDLMEEWLHRIRSSDTAEKQQQIEEVIQKWYNVLKLAPKQMSKLLRRRIGVHFLPPYTNPRARVRTVRPEPIPLKDVLELPNMGIQQLPFWQPWHSGASDPFEPIKYFRTCINEPEWFSLLYTSQKKKFLSNMDSTTVSRGSKIYGWSWFLVHSPFLESLLTLWILAFKRDNFFANLWIPQDDLISWQMTIYYFINFFAFASMEISIGVWATIPARTFAALCFGILAYGLKYILKSILLMMLAYAVGGCYYFITKKRDRPIAEIMACFAFILVYPSLGIMLVICMVAFPWEDQPRKYLIVGFVLHLFSYLFYDYSMNLLTKFLL